MSDGSLFDIDTVAPLAIPPAASTASTTSLYRKYRPQSFDADDLFGQEHVVNTLRNAISLDRVAHAYLFCGPRGTGKTTTARLMAKAVNCLDPEPHHRPCNACDACIAINRNATTDVIEIDAASNRGIDDIRDLRERVKYAPTQLRTKFYIIDEAHQITGAAANAFLKTLEEPPAHTKFILATTDPEELLQTIVSRCQRFDFRRIGLAAMSACLRKVAALENITIDEPAIDAIARHATGSLRDGLGLLDQVSLYREHAMDENVTVTVDLVRKVLGISRNERVEGVLTAIADRDAAAGLRLIGEAVDDGDDVRQLAKQILTYVRLLLIQRANGSSDADDVARNLALRFDLAELATVAHRFGDVDFKIRHAVLPQLPLELAFIDVIAKQQAASPTLRAGDATPSHGNDGRPPGPEPEAPRFERQPEPAPTAKRPSLKDRVRGDSTAPSRPQPAPATTTAAPTPAPPAAMDATTQPPGATAPAAPGAVAIETIIDLWPRIRSDVKALDRKAEAIMQQIDPVTVNGDTVVLASPYEFHRNRMNQDDIRHTVEDVLSRLLKTKVTTTCVSHEDAAALRNRARQHAPVVSTVASERDPLPESPGIQSSAEDDERRIVAVQNLFDATEVPVQPRGTGVPPPTGDASGLADDDEVADN